MFPQSELDNYKLQVELLQEKLQRSEISRQQLEHKLNKIIQKRDEHDKVVRSKARQKYQQFLEEQRRRNERNKQLVQMLERIEQQTEVLNAKSERLKMMKLQYEMYFAKLVHSQTRRCIQNSISPMTQTMHPPSTQTIQVTKQHPTLEVHSYEINDTHAPEMFYPYRANDAASYFEKESFLRSDSENMQMISPETPTLANFDRTSGNGFRNLNDAPSKQVQPLETYSPNNETIINHNIIPENDLYHKQKMQNYISYPKTNTNMPLTSASTLLTNNKQLSEFKETPNLNTTQSSTFEDITNVNMMPHNMRNSSVLPNTTSTTVKTYNDEATKHDTINNNANIKPLDSTQNVPEILPKYKNVTSNLQSVNPCIDTVKLGSENLRNDIINSAVNIENELKTHDITMPKLHKKPSTSLEIEMERPVNLTSPKSSNDTNYANGQTGRTEQIKKESPNTIVSNSSETGVSIENIENKIYGELLSPLETEQVQKVDNSKVVPKLLENLITQQENVEIKNIPPEKPVVEHDGALNGNSINDITLTDNGTENSVTLNYDETKAYNVHNNTIESQELTNRFGDYSNYENADSTAVEESQQQQEQYDYSNYDPTQYTYPGYIYDETTGEYKPDPNAPPEQYTTDQQYASEGYDQQYQQQGYDYNQIYSEDPTVTTTPESTGYNNYNTDQQEISSNFTKSDTNAYNNTEQQEISSNLTPSDSNSQGKENVTNPEPILLQADSMPREIPKAPTMPTKVAKPTSILSTADKNDGQKKKKRVNFIESSETEESASDGKVALSTAKLTTGNLSGSSESDFDFPSSTDAEPKAT